MEVQKCWEFGLLGVKCGSLFTLSTERMPLCSGKQAWPLERCDSWQWSKPQQWYVLLELITVSRCTPTTRKTPDASYLIDGNIVTRLLKAGGVVVPVPHDNPHLVENNSTNQLVGALDLHHYGHDVVWGLEERNKSTIYKRCGLICLFFIPNSSFWYKVTQLASHHKSRIICLCVCATSA